MNKYSVHWIYLSVPPLMTNLVGLSLSLSLSIYLYLNLFMLNYVLYSLCKLLSYLLANFDIERTSECLKFFQLNIIFRVLFHSRQTLAIFATTKWSVWLTNRWKIGHPNTPLHSSSPLFNSQASGPSWYFVFNHRFKGELVSWQSWSNRRLCNSTQLNSSGLVLQRSTRGQNKNVHHSN